MLRKTLIVLATASALTGALTADAVALATAHTGWDGLGDGGGRQYLNPTRHGPPGNVTKLGHTGRPHGTVRGHLGRGRDSPR